MSISIVTKFLGPTNHRGSRVSAQVSDYGSDMEVNSRADGRPGRIVIDWDHRYNPAENHRRAAFALANKLGWDGEWIGGDAPRSEGWVFVCVRTGLQHYGFTVPDKPAPAPDHQ